MQTSGSNANDIEIGVNKSLEQLSKSFPPGIKYSKVISSKERLDEAISQVKSTLLEAFVLVFIIVFLFYKTYVQPLFRLLLFRLL